MGLGRRFCFGHNLARSTKRREKEDECGNFKGWQNHLGFGLGPAPPLAPPMPQAIELKRFMNTDSQSFIDGLVFGFDVGTGSIGYAVRRGKEFLDVGVLICDSEGSDLSKRRELRRQRRTLRSKKYRRQWFDRELVKLGLPKPENPPNDPISLRLRALNGDELKPEELHAALTHLFKRRGYSKVPWAKAEAVRKNGEKAKQEESDTQKAISELEQEMKNKGCKYPCQLLDLRRKEAGVLPKAKWGRNFPWGRQMLETEFCAIAEAQKDHFPELVKNAEMLLHHNTREITREIDGKKHTFHVFFKTDTRKKPGVLGIRWPKFENRGPGLDALEPFRKDHKTGAWIPQHTLRRDKLLFKEWQLEVALRNFRVKRRLITTGRSKKEKFEMTPPPPPALEALRKLWNERGHLWAEDLREWAKNYEGQFELRDPDFNLTPRNDFSGRARFSKHGMAAIRKVVAEAREKHDAAYDAWEEKFKDKNPKANEEDIANGYARFLTQFASVAPSNQGVADNAYARTVAPPPVLILPSETSEDAFQRHLNAIRDPQVRHRVELFGRELRRLMKLHSQNQAPDFIIIEMARDLMMNQDQKDIKEAKDKERRDDRDKAAQILRDMGYVPDADNIKKFLLAQEAGWRCPFTLQPFCQSDFSKLTITQLVQAENKPHFVKEASSVFGRLEVEHLVPRTPVVCNEWFNLTVTLHSTNAQKRKRTPFQWLSVDKDGVPADLDWEHACKNAAERFGANSLKNQIFASPIAAEIVEDNAKRSIQQTAYIARCLREACLILFGKEWLDWTDGAGRDPRLLPDNRASTSYLTTNGAITARLRDAWHLNELLWPKPQRLNDAEWNKLTDEEKTALKAKYKEERDARALKNRQDHRHHALDAMVISCAMPWQTFKPRLGNQQSDDGLCELDAVTGAVTKTWNPVFNDYGFGIMRTAKSKMDLLLKFSADRQTDLLRHHKSSQRNAQAFDTTPYGRREKFGGDELGQTLFVARKRMLDLKTSHLDPRNTGGFIFSPLLRDHIAKEWESFSGNEKNWLRVQSDWIGIFEGQIAVLLASGKDDQKTRMGIKARESRIYKLRQMEGHKDWDELLSFIAKELGAQQPQPRFPSQFIETLRHPIYGTPITSVKVTAQSKDDDSFLLVREPTSEKARSGTYVMRKQEDKYREMRVYRLPKPGRSGAYACWLLLPWYGKLDTRGKRFKKVENDFMTPACKGAEFVRSFRRDEIVCFANSHLASKGIKQNESWRIVRTDAKGDFLANVGLLPANLVRETSHPITDEKVKLEPVVVALNDFMKALEQTPSADELPHPPSVKPQPPGAAEA
jgi:CRISPR-associated endonuclease Csn1